VLVTADFVSLYLSPVTPFQLCVGLVEACGSDSEIRKFGRWLKLSSCRFRVNGEKLIFLSFKLFDMLLPLAKIVYNILF